MGYHTEFNGSFKLAKPLTEDQIEFMRKFNETRRMKRDPKKITNAVTNEKVGLPLGEEGEMFVDGSGDFGQGREDNIINFNDNGMQPSLWCQWVPNDEGTEIEWDGGEKFYEYVGWIEFIIERMLKPWGNSITGTVEWRGEEWSDTGAININSNDITVEGEY